MVGLDVELQGTALAVVSHDVAVVLGVEHIVQFDDIGMIQFLEDAYLVLE